MDVNANANAKHTKYSNLVLSGGSLKAISFIGCLKYLEEIGQVKNLQSLIGSSAGAIFSFLIALGYNSTEITKEFKDAILKYKEYDIDIDRLINIYEYIGIDDGSFFENLCRSWLKKKLNCDTITFIDFAKQTGKNLVICASNIVNRKETYFSLDTTPNMCVLFALKASIAIPLVFTPVILKTDKEYAIYVDAGLFNNFPLDYLKKSVLQNTLGIKISYNPVIPENLNLFNYLNLIMDATFDKLNQKNDDDVDNITIVTIPDKYGDYFCFDINTLKFKMDVDQIDKYVEHGYAQSKSKILLHVGL